MKLRISDNSNRLQLTQSEVDTIRSEGLVTARVSFPGGAALDYVLESTPGTVKPSAHFSDGAWTAVAGV